MRTLPVAVFFTICLVATVKGDLLTPSTEAQLESWLGRGDLDFTNVFTKVAGDGQDGSDFHAAADYKGETFTLIQVSGGNNLVPEQVIGGYNPHPWDTFWGNNNVITSNDEDRTAFIYNMTSGLIQRQTLSTANVKGSYGEDVGEIQSENFSDYGPVFGRTDIIVEEALTPEQIEEAGFGYTGALEWGRTFNQSYGGTIFGQNIIFGGPMDNYAYDYYAFHIDRIEVYSIPPVSESSSSIWLLFSGLVCLFFVRKRIVI